MKQILMGTVFVVLATLAAGCACGPSGEETCLRQAATKFFGEEPAEYPRLKDHTDMHSYCFQNCEKKTEHLKANDECEYVSDTTEKISCKHAVYEKYLDAARRCQSKCNDLLEVCNP